MTGPQTGGGGEDAGQSRDESQGRGQPSGGGAEHKTPGNPRPPSPAMDGRQET